MKWLISLVAAACVAVAVTGSTWAASGPPRQAKTEIRNDIAAAIVPGLRKPDADRLRDVVRRIDESLDPRLWIDDSNLDPKDGARVFDREKDAVHRLLELERDKKSSLADTTLQGWLNDLVRVDYDIVETARAGINPSGECKPYDESTIELGKAFQAYDPDNPELSAGRPEEAIDHIKHSWQKAMEAERHC